MLDLRTMRMGPWARTNDSGDAHPHAYQQFCTTLGKCKGEELGEMGRGSEKAHPPGKGAPAPNLQPSNPHPQHCCPLDRAHPRRGSTPTNAPALPHSRDKSDHAQQAGRAKDMTLQRTRLYQTATDVFNERGGPTTVSRTKRGWARPHTPCVAHLVFVVDRLLRLKQQLRYDVIRQGLNRGKGECWAISVWEASTVPRVACVEGAHVPPTPVAFVLKGSHCGCTKRKAAER